jgi:hypothetical protein
MAELRQAELLEDRDHLLEPLAAAGNRLAAQIVIVQQLIESHGRLDPLHDKRVSHLAAESESDQDADRAWRGDLRLLQQLQVPELAERAAPPTPRVEVKVVSLSLVFEPPHLRRVEVVAGIRRQTRAGAGQVAQLRFELSSRVGHAREGKGSRPARVCQDA